MATIYKACIVDIDLDNPDIYRKMNHVSLGYGDSYANRFGVRVTRNGRKESLTGCVASGYFIRADGTTVALNEYEKKDNEIWLKLPTACYAVPGYFQITMKITGSSVTDTVLVVNGTVIETTTNAMIDPGSAIPPLEDYLEEVNNAVEAANTIFNMQINYNLISGTRYSVQVIKE